MAEFFEDLTGVVLGSSVLVVVELIPILTNGTRTSDVSLSSAFAKIRLQELSLVAGGDSLINTANKSGLGIQWDSRSKENDAMDVNDDGKTLTPSNRLRRGVLFSRERRASESTKNDTTDEFLDKELSNYPRIDFPSEDPMAATSIPCVAIGYSFTNGSQHNSTLSNATITKGTLVRILPGISVGDLSELYSSCPFGLDELCGEAEAGALTEEMVEETVHSHNPETIRELQLRMSSQLSQPIAIGTTEDAIWLRNRQQIRRIKLVKALQRHCCQSTRTQGFPPKDKQLNNLATNSSLPSIMRDGALLLHCPNHGTGKTALVKYVAKNLLDCDAVHVLQPGALLAKYGSNADTGLESMMHAITVSAAVKRHSSISIIFDHFDAFMPSSLSGRSSKGDAAAPVLKAIGKCN